MSSISLRQWIKKCANNTGTLDHRNRSVNGALSTSNGDRQQQQKQAALSIAISLAEQIARAEKLAACGITGELDVLPCSGDWCEYCWVSFKGVSASNEVSASGRGDERNGSGSCTERSEQWNREASPAVDDEWLHAPLPIASSNDCDETNQDDEMNAQLESFLKSFGFDADEHPGASECKRPSIQEVSAGRRGAVYFCC